MGRVQLDQVEVRCSRIACCLAEVGDDLRDLALVQFTGGRGFDPQQIAVCISQRGPGLGGQRRGCNRRCTLWLQRGV
ncbi:hypothetical protein D3C78_1869330 [compost metagenome]